MPEIAPRSTSAFLKGYAGSDLCFNARMRREMIFDEPPLSHRAVQNKERILLSAELLEEPDPAEDPDVRRFIREEKLQELMEAV